MDKNNQETIIVFTGISEKSAILKELIEKGKLSDKENPVFIVDSRDNLSRVYELAERDPQIILCCGDEEPDLETVLKNVRGPIDKIGIILSMLSEEPKLDVLDTFVETIMHEPPLEMDTRLLQDKTYPSDRKPCKKLNQLNRTKIAARKPLIVRRTHP